ncbi:unnamed protein product [Adineta ricciae]|uniref:Helix-turn-helix domain-containing protein n=1 Tax=Adineta ricciae TaxID=249248 RepID=A0A815X338_ADIRI|nr:unnamed protein product [Adineta ricciae]CAF1675924.1 unnamed protein product [Adineta ricciae]
MRNIYKITYSIGFKNEFLDVHTENVNGTLITPVFHKPAAEPYVLPFGSDHPRHIYINIVYEALLRAARLSSNVQTFDKERLRIEMILLLNGYPPKFIRQHFHRFFRLNQAMEVLTLLNVRQYEKLHEKLLYLPTRREKKVLLHQRAALTTIADDDDDNNKHLYNSDDQAISPESDFEGSVLAQ